jgi:hypothetical protein
MPPPAKWCARRCAIGRTKRNLREQGLDDLRRVWKEAMDDNSPEEVFNRLEQKYRALAEAAGDKRECA